MTLWISLFVVIFAAVACVLLAYEFEQGRFRYSVWQPNSQMLFALFVFLVMVACVLAGALGHRALTN